MYRDWGNACNIHLDPIVKLVKKCIRTITYSTYFEHTQPLYNSLNILCFHKFVISLIMFKTEVGLVSKPISQLFTINNEYHDYNTRHSSSLHLSVGRGEATYRSFGSFSFHGINVWNYLKMHVPIDVSYLRFKKITLSYLIADDIVYRIKS